MLAIWWQVSAKKWFTGPKHTIDQAVSRRSTSEPADRRRTTRLEALLDRLPVLRAFRARVELPGGLTNQNLRVTTADAGRRRARFRVTRSSSASTVTPST